MIGFLKRHLAVRRFVSDDPDRGDLKRLQIRRRDNTGMMAATNGKMAFRVSMRDVGPDVDAFCVDPKQLTGAVEGMDSPSPDAFAIDVSPDSLMVMIARGVVSFQGKSCDEGPVFPNLDKTFPSPDTEHRYTKVSVNPFFLRDLLDGLIEAVGMNRDSHFCEMELMIRPPLEGSGAYSDAPVYLRCQTRVDRGDFAEAVLMPIRR